MAGAFGFLMRFSIKRFLLNPRCMSLANFGLSPGVRIICIYGNCGVGKSSLLNAILAIEDASLKTGDGGSGTLVPIEIWRAPDRQQYPFTAVVFYFPLPLCEEIVRNQLANYYDARLAPIEDQCKELVDLGKPALKTFLALFGDKEEFADEGAATRFLARAKSADDPKILTKLLEWTRYIVSELSKLGNCATLPHHTAQDLNKALEPFTQTCEDPVIDGTDLECSVWPFVKKARKYLSNPLLAKKICLVDLPGVSDTNQQRVQLTKSYFRQCHQALIVHGIERAEDDRTLEEYVIDVFRRKRSGSVAVVLSRSDDIEQESNSRTKYSRQQEEQLRSLNDIEDDLGTELKAIRKRMRKSGNSDYVADMKTEELDQFLLKQVRCRRTGILVAARNTKIRKSLQDWYASITNDPQPLPVFCVSSKCYMAHVKGSSAQNPPILTVAMTEIPDVRSYLFSIAGNGGCVNALKHYAVQIRILLNQMDMSCSGLKPMMKRDDLLKVLDGARRGVENAFDGVRQEQNKHSVTPILIKFDTTEDVWIEKAQEYCTRISKYTPAGFTSFLKKGGNWKTPACGKHNWNATLIEPVRADIQPLLDRFHIQGCYIFQTDAVQAVSDMLDKLEQDMKGERSS
jgi:GTP-binding protein EngB required for normal cell division